MEPVERSEQRKKRVRLLKRMILGTIAAAILIPTTICIILAVLLHRSNAELVSLREQYEALLALQSYEQENTMPETDGGVFEVSEVAKSERVEIPAAEEIPVEAGRKVYLTFDDGPSSSTDEILDILKEYDVKATFFVVGRTDEHSLASYKRIVEEGHTLALHSYSHKYSEVYRSVEDFTEDLKSLQELLYDTTGVWPRYYRFPGGSSNTVSRIDMKEFIRALDEQDISYFDWNVASGDAVKGYISPQQILANCMDRMDRDDTCVVLLHDAAERKTTVEALPMLIEAIQAMDDTVILPIDENTKPIRHVEINE